MQFVTSKYQNEHKSTWEMIQVSKFKNAKIFIFEILGKVVRRQTHCAPNKNIVFDEKMLPYKHYNLGKN